PRASGPSRRPPVGLGRQPRPLPAPHPRLAGGGRGFVGTPRPGPRRAGRPPGGDAVAPEALVRCDYVRPATGPMPGHTPKFLCRRGRDVLKVKWGAENGEVFAEVAATRLFWVLGFPADEMYPVRVECRGCPEDPWQGGEYEPASTRQFAPAVVERLFPGETIEEYEDQGWTWGELKDFDVSAGGASRAEVDALKLLAAFVQH